MKMTDKERLEMIKHDFEERGQYGGFIDDYDTSWLIEKVEVQQKEIEGLKIVIEIERSFIQNKLRVDSSEI
jgi:hypothetical protein